MKNNDQPHTLTGTVITTDLADMFGGTEEDIILYCDDLLKECDLSYRLISGDERDRLILHILQKIHSPAMPKAGTSRLGDWESGWGKNLTELIETDYNLKALVPKYFIKNRPARLKHQYIQPGHEDFVLQMSILFRNWLFQKYLADYEHIYEIGCGPAWHLAYLAERFPGKRLYGYDWADSSKNIIESLSDHYGWNMTGGHFDFFNPDPDLVIEPGGAVFTFGALEQVGADHQAYLSFLLSRSPALCIDVAGIHEFYDDTLLTDYLSLSYHHRRNYLKGYYTRLKELERQGKIEILVAHYQPFGNVYDDPHSYVIWRPVTS